MTDTTFVGTSSRSITEALQNAIGSAKGGSSASEIRWEIQSIFGVSDNALAEKNEISVKIKVTSSK